MPAICPFDFRCKRNTSFYQVKNSLKFHANTRLQIIQGIITLSSLLSLHFEDVESSPYIQIISGLQRISDTISFSDFQDNISPHVLREKLP